MFSDREANKEPPSSRLWEDPFPPLPWEGGGFWGQAGLAKKGN